MVNSKTHALLLPKPLTLQSPYLKRPNLKPKLLPESKSNQTLQSKNPRELPFKILPTIKYI